MNAEAAIAKRLCRQSVLGGWHTTGLDRSQMLQPEEIVAKVGQLRELDVEYRLFGASFHRYVLHPGLPENEIKSTETQYSMSLPRDYRLFITQVGNGGAGPDYGVFRFGDEDNDPPTRWKYLLGDLSQPFPHAQAWDLPESFWDDAPDLETIEKEHGEDEAEREYEKWRDHLGEHYWAGRIMNGAIPICHCGCNHRVWLVVNGAEKGNLWGDSRASEAGIYPLEVGGKERVTFGEWYVTWLNESLEKVRPRGNGRHRRAKRQ